LNVNAFHLQAPQGVAAVSAEAALPPLLVVDVHCTVADARLIETLRFKLDLSHHT